MKRHFYIYCPAVSGVVLCLVACPVRGDEPSAEKLRDLRAALVLKLIRFTIWPESAFADDKSPIAVCVAGDEKLVVHMRKIAEEAGGRGRGVTVRFLRTPSGRARREEWEEWAVEVRRCHVLYVDSSLKSRSREMLGELGDADVLTVGDGAGFTERGGMLGIFWNGAKYVLEANPRRIGRTRVRVNSNVLELAKVVKATE